MTGYSYAPAQAHEWLAVATAGRLLVAKVDDTSDRVAQLAATGEPSTTVQGVIEVLTADGLGATGPFALLFWVDGDLTDKGLGVIVRGEATVLVQTTDGEVTVSSRGVTTWTEQVIEGPTGFRVDLNVSAVSGMPHLPLQQGAAWISGVRLARSAPSDGPATSGAAAPASARKARREAASVPERPEASPRTAPAATPAAPPAEPAPLHEETRVFHTTTRDDVTALEASDADQNPPEPEADGYDYLFGATVFRPIGAAAVLAADDEDAASPLPETQFLADPETATGSATAAPTPGLGDHDGRTILASDIQAARQRSGSAQTSTPVSNRPAPLPPAHRYVLQLPEGKSQALSAPVILGRAPSVSNVPASVLPHLVTLIGDDISRSHVRVAVEGDTVVVTDLHSSNGTHVIAPGKLPQLLRAGEPTPVISGTTIDLGSDVLLHVTEA